jgi:hypothetical protein
LSFVCCSSVAGFEIPEGQSDKKALSRVAQLSQESKKSERVSGCNGKEKDEGDGKDKDPEKVCTVMMID